MPTLYQAIINLHRYSLLHVILEQSNMRATTINTNSGLFNSNLSAHQMFGCVIARNGWIYRIRFLSFTNFMNSINSVKCGCKICFPCLECFKYFLREKFQLFTFLRSSSKYQGQILIFLCRIDDVLCAFI